MVDVTSIINNSKLTQLAVGCTAYSNRVVIEFLDGGKIVGVSSNMITSVRVKSIMDEAIAARWN